jgi:hypothetical protein
MNAGMNVDMFNNVSEDENGKNLCFLKNKMNSLVLISYGTE